MEISKRKLILEKLKNRIQLEPSDIIELQNNPLTRTEAFSIVEDDPQRIKEYSKFSDLQEKASKGELIQEELKFLCDTAFGKDSEESKKIYNAMIESNRVKQDEKK